MQPYRVGYDRYLMMALLAAAVLQGGRCAPADGEPPAADGQQSPSGGGGVSAFVSATISEAGKIGTEVTTATEETLKAAGRFSMAAIRLLVSLVGGASQTTAAAGNALASGVKQVNKITGTVPVIGTVTSGVEKLVTGAAKTFKENSDYATDRRTQLMDELKDKLDGYTPGSKSGAATGGGEAVDAA